MYHIFYQMEILHTDVSPRDRTINNSDTVYHVLTVGRALGMNNYLSEFKDFKIPARTQTRRDHWLPLPNAASETTDANLWLEEIKKIT